MTIRSFAVDYQDVFEFLTLVSFIAVLYGAAKKKIWILALGQISLSFALFFLSLGL